MLYFVSQGKMRWFAFVLMFGLSLGCSAAGLVQRTVATPPPTRALAPTFTPTSETILPKIIVTPPVNGTPGVIIIPPGMDPSSVLPKTPTATPAPITPPDTVPPGAQTPASDQPPSPVTATLPPAPTDTPLPTPTATATPTPFIVVDNGLVTLRRGPGVEYPVVAQLGPRIPVSIIGQNPEGSWYQLCCVSGESVWVARTHVHVHNDPSGAPLFNAEPPPLPTPTNLPTETPTITPTPTATFVPFERAVGPQFFPTENRFVTIWVKLFVGTPPTEAAAEGYFLRVQFQNVDRPASNGVKPSTSKFDVVGPPGTGYANLLYNLKYEFVPPGAYFGMNTPTPAPAQLWTAGTWSVYVIDGAGNQLSDIVTFTTDPNNPNREVYIAWVRVR